MEVISAKTAPYAQPESSSETHPTRGKTKSLLVLKNCGRNFICHHGREMVVSYKECLRNHAASLGGHALDGCGEFMPSPSAAPTDPASLKCAVCGCHRNFHRREPCDVPAFIHHLPPPPPPPPPNPSSSPSRTISPGSSISPTHTPPSPFPYSYYSSAPHMLLALGTGNSGSLDEFHHHLNHSNHTAERIENNNSRRKRSRTKFTMVQKEKMHALAERLGWRMPKSEERSVQEFCNEVGIQRGVLKVWMHNNKNTYGKKEISAAGNLNLDDNNNNGNASYSNSDIHNNGSSSAS